MNTVQVWMIKRDANQYKAVQEILRKNKEIKKLYVNSEIERIKLVIEVHKIKQEMLFMRNELIEMKQEISEMKNR